MPETKPATSPEDAAIEAALSAPPVNSSVAPVKVTPPPAESPKASLAWRAMSDVAQGARELVPAVVAGAQNAVNNADDKVNSAWSWIVQKTGVPNGYLSTEGNDFLNWHSGSREKAKLFPDTVTPPDPTSNTGKFIENATTFAVGMLGVGKVFRAAGIVSEGGALAKAGVQAAKGAAAEATVLDSYQERLSNIIQQVPSLSNPLTRFLAADPKDNKATAVFKQAVEGVLTGFAAEGLFHGAKVIRASRLLTDKTVDRAVAEAAVRKQLSEMDTVLNNPENGAKFSPAVKPDGSFGVQETATGEFHPGTFASQEHAASEAGTLNMVAKEQARTNTPGALTPDQIESIRSQAKTLMTSTDPAEINRIVEGTDHNFLRVSGEEDAKAWIESISGVMKDEITAGRGGALVTHEDTRQMASDLFPDEDPAKIMGALDKLYNNTLDMAAHLYAGRVLMYNLGQRVSYLSLLADGDPSNALSMARLGGALDSLFYVSARVKGVVTSVARTLESQSMDVAPLANATGVAAVKNIPAAAEATAGVAESALGKEATKGGTNSFVSRKILASLDGMTPDQMRTLATRIRLAEGDPTQILAITKAAPREVPPTSWWGKFVGVHNEYWINSLLSGTKTSVVNFTSNLSMALATPIEYFNAGVLSGDKQLRQQGSDMLLGQAHGLRDSWAAAAKALRTGENILDPGFPTNESGVTHNIGGYIGELVRSPSRFLMSSDEFFKQMAYRTNVRAGLLKEARAMSITGDRLSQYLSDGMNAAFLPDGRGISKAGIAYAEETTFTSPLPKGTISNSLQQITTDHPITKLILPFVRTPTNILDWTWERTPILASFNKQVREDLAAGGARRALAQSKLGTGMALWSTAGLLAYQGQITGKGPADPVLRKQWLDTHQPYSIKVPGIGWMEYKRVDPVLSPLGVVADLFHSSGELHSQDYLDVATAFASAVAMNVTSKTYLAGITNAMEVMTSGDPNKTKQFLENHLGTYVPNLLNQLNPDDPMREVRGYVDAMLARLPGFSTTLPARRNLFGEPVLKAPGELNRAFNPFTLSGKSEDTPSVDAKLLEIGKGIAMPDKFAPGTGDLGQAAVDMTSKNYGLGEGNMTPYDRMMELIAKPKSGGPSLRTALTKAVNSPDWDKLPQGDASIQPGGVKYNIVMKIVGAYRQQAMAQVRKEFPLLNRAIIQATITKGVNASGGPDQIQRIQDLFKQGQQ